MKKLIAVLLCACVLTACLTACSGGGDDSESESGPANSLIVGVIASTTGVAAEIGTSFLNGVKKSAAQIEYLTSAQTDRIKIEVKAVDDGGSPAKAQAAYAELKAAGAKVILGPTTDACCLAVAEAIADDGLLHITPTASGAQSIKGKSSFRLCCSDALQGERMAEYLLERGGFKNVAVVCGEDGTSAAIAETFISKFTALGGAIACTLTPKSVVGDPKKSADSIMRGSAQAVFIPTDAATAADCAKALYAAGVKLPLSGGEEWDKTTSHIKEEDKACVKGALYLAPFIDSDGEALTSAFCESYENEYGTRPDRAAAYGYDALSLVKLLVDQAGAPSSDELSAENLIAIMANVKYPGVTGEIAFDVAGEPVRNLRIAKIEG